MNAEQQNNEVELQQRDPQPVLSIRATIPIDQLGAVMGDRLAALAAYLQQSDARPAGPPFVRYHTFADGETDMEVGVPVGEPLAGAGQVANGELPGGPAITTWHRGPHDKLGEAYARLGAWLNEQGREPDGAAYEVYHWIDLSREVDDTIAAVEDSIADDPTTWRTQLVQPIR